MLVGRIGQFNQGTATQRQPGAGHAVRRVPVLERRRVRAGQLEAAVEPHARIRRALRQLDQQRGARAASAATSRPTLYDPTKGSFLDPGTFQRVNGVCYVETGCAPAGVLPNRSPFALPRVNVAWDIDGEGNNVVRGGYGMFYNRNMGNVEYDNTLRLAPNAYQVATDFWAGGGYGNGARPDLRHGQRGHAGQPHRQHRHQLADARFVQVAEDAQLQRVVRAADSVEPGGRGELRRHARPRSREPQQRQRDAVRRAELRHLQRRRSVGAGQPRRGRERRRQSRRRSGRSTR